MRPLPLPGNSVPRFYLGGPEIARLRGTEPAGERVPEDWVGSTTTVFGEEELGLSRLADGRILRAAIAEDPVAFLGPDHAARRGAEPGLLVKLLDAGERLPVHVHPDDAFARDRLRTPHGKTEAWIVIATTKADASVAAGFREDVDADTLARWVHDQDHDALLGALNPIPVRPGDAVFVPAGTAHAIGDGVLIVELQQPSDLSVLLEWDGFGIADEAEASLGLGWDVALRCVDLGACDTAALRYAEAAAGGGVTRLLPPAADAFFRADHIAPAPVADLERGFAILVVIEGEGSLAPEDGAPMALRRGDTVLVPWAAGRCTIEGGLAAIACRPAAAGAEGAP